MAIPSLSECNPGFDPVEYNVVIAPEVVEEKTAGGIFLPDAKKEMDELAAVKGRLVSCSPLAFSYDKWPEGSRLPQPGDVVIYAKYGGTLIKGEDGREYRLLKDKDIAAVVTACA
ncbi:MAG: co-chaperone GroES [Ignavibacteriales bacterium]